MAFKAFLEKYKHLLVMLLIFAMGTLIFGWVGYENLRESAGLGKREIIHDEYSVITAGILGSEGVKQNIIVKPDTRLYGVNLDFHIYNRVCFGTVFVDLLDKEGNLLASASDDMTTILDNTFKRFIFDKMVVSEEKQEYVLHVHTSPETENDRIALWKSERTKDGFPLTENAKDASGTVALQYITNYVGGFIYTAYFVICAFLLGFLLVLYYLVFVKKSKIHNIFVLCALCLGLVFCLFTPQRGGPDEYAHIATSYYNASRILGMKAVDEKGNLMMRECDAVPLNRPCSYNAFEWKETYEGLVAGTHGKTELVPVKATITSVFPPLYFAQTLGVLLARILNFGYIPMLLMGRAFNLLLYVVLVYLAIKTLPFFKLPLCLVSLLPIPLQLAGSFSYDTLVMGMCFLFIALCFKYAYGKETLSAKQIGILAVLGALIAPSKTIYITVVALCFIIPSAKFKSKKVAYLAKVGIIALALCMWLGYNSGIVSHTVSDINVTAKTQEQLNAAVTEGKDALDLSEIDIPNDHSIMANGDSSYCFSFGYMMTHISQTIKILINSIQDDMPLYVQGLIGGRLGEIIVSPLEINWLYPMALIILLLLSLVPSGTHSIQYKGVAKWWGLFVAISACGLAVLACLTWTPINYTTIFGLQGRYFLPVFPLILFALTNDNLRLKKSVDGVLIFSFICTDILILLDAFTIMAVNLS